MTPKTALSYCGVTVAALATLVSPAAASAAAVPSYGSLQAPQFLEQQKIPVGGQTALLARQLGEKCAIDATTADSTTIQCNDIAMALVGPMIELHLPDDRMKVEVTSTKTGSINYALDYSVRNSRAFIDQDSGTIAPGTQKTFLAPQPLGKDTDWYLGLDGKLMNFGSARIVLTHMG